MHTLKIPSEGMELRQTPELDNGIDALPQQIVQLDLAHGTLQRLIKEAREGKSKISLTSGKSALVGDNQQSGKNTVANYFISPSTILTSPTLSRQ